MDDFNTDDIIDEIISSPPAKRKENKETKSLDSTSELRRSTKSVTFVDQDNWDSKSNNGKEAPAVIEKASTGRADSGKPVKGRLDDFDDDNPPLSGLDTPRSEESSVTFPDDSPRKSSGGSGTGLFTMNAPKKGFDIFTTSSTVTEELAPKATKKDFDSFLGSLSANKYGSASSKDEAEDQLNNSGSAYQPWAASKSRPASGGAAMDIDSVLQGVDLTLTKKRPVTAPAPVGQADKVGSADVVEKPAKKTLSHLLAGDADGDLFATAPAQARKKQRAATSLVAMTEARVTQQQQPPPSSPSSRPAASSLATFELEFEQPAAAASMIEAALLPSQPPSLSTAPVDDNIDDMFTVKRPPTGRRARGGDNLNGLFDGDGKSAESYFSMPSIPLSSEMKLELEGEIKKLRREKEDLKQQNELLERKLKEEQTRSEESQRKKLADTKELFRRSEEMLVHENEQLKQKYSEILHQMDLERTKMRSEFNRQLDEMAQEKRQDVDKLREQHRSDVEALRSAAPHAGALSNLVDRLGHLSDKLGTLSDRESSHRLKDEVYRQSELTDRQVMHEVVQALKVRVDESARSERWLNDLATQLMEERRTLTAERSELRVLKLTEGARHSEKEAERLALADERARLQELEARLRHSRSEVLRQKSDLETLAEELKLKEEKLIDGQRSLEERLEIVSRREKTHREQQAKMDAVTMEQAERVKRAEGIQTELADLRAKEREVSQAMIQLAEERASLDKRAGSLLCANCRIPTRDAGGLAIGGGLKMANSIDFAFARSRHWDDIEEEKLYLESLSHAPY